MVLKVIEASENKRMFFLKLLGRIRVMNGYSTLAETCTVIEHCGAEVALCIAESNF